MLAIFLQQLVLNDNTNLFSAVHTEYGDRVKPFESADGDSMFALLDEGIDTLYWTGSDGNLNVETYEPGHGRYHHIFSEQVPMLKAK